MKTWIVAGLSLLAAPAWAGEAGDGLAQSLYEGQSGAFAAAFAPQCDLGEGDACFALGMAGLVSAYETFAKALYRHGAVTPDARPLSLFLGLGSETISTPGNPDPEPLSYRQFRDILDGFSKDLDAAGRYMMRAGQGSDFVVPIDPLKVRIDFDGDGTAGETETLGTLLYQAGGYFDIPSPDAQPPSGKVKTKSPAADLTIGFDNADGFWFAGYANVTAAPVEIALAHDFSAFFDNYFHRIFPEAGLPMEEYSRGSGTMFMDAESDAFFADAIAAIHTSRFPVIDKGRLSAVLVRLANIIMLSRQNWDAILAETDDDRELVPSPRQTSLVPGREVTEDVVAAWRQALDSVDEILHGDLLIPHWRFKQGFNLKTYFETAEETDLVLLFTGSGALPFLDDGPIADAESFAEINRVMGDDWPMFALWFN
ncbi:hypothetical protein VW35_05810 [Devosia soli]|uniref:Uncharacterized protein n=1 Tax=Devosia soli TaxID=361041 RepID=A0A0F5LC94_9HYPH|nr:hypothetical protein [Devosia soli]KKB79978.1 hypothetical protein VW35_05810 [Devosia soli]